MLSLTARITREDMAFVIKLDGGGVHLVKDGWFVFESIAMFLSRLWLFEQEDKGELCQA